MIVNNVVRRMLSPLNALKSHIAPSGSMIPTGPLVRAAPLIASIATTYHRVRFASRLLKYALYRDMIAPVINMVSSMSTRHTVPERNTSKVVSIRMAVRSPLPFSLRPKNLVENRHIRLKARADGRRAVSSVTRPAGRDNKAISQ